MSSPVISVEHLSKAYRIGVKEEIPDTLMGAMKNVVTAPWKNFKALRRLNTSTDSPSADIAPAPIPNPQSPVANPLPDSDTLWALRDVSFEINQGDVVGIIGRNGAGKSTLLKILSRITEPTSGRAVIRGRVSSLLEVGTGFHPELTGRENVYMNGTILGMRKKEIDRKFDEIVDFSGIEKFLDTPTKRYSSGMQVRLAFAVAAHLEPEILVIDEVLAVGDAEFQKKCIGKMQNVANAGRTVIFVSHNMDAVRQLTQSCVHLQHGSVQAIGPSDAMVDKYLQHLKTEVIPTGRINNSHRHNKELSREIEFDKLEFPGGRAVFDRNEPLQFTALLNVRKLVKSCRISGTVLTLEGTPVGSFFSHEFEQFPQCPGAAFGVRVTLFPHQLAPGLYYLGVATGSGNNIDGHRDYDVIKECLPFEIVFQKAGGSHLSVWAKSWGKVQFNPPALELLNQSKEAASNG